MGAQNFNFAYKIPPKTGLFSSKFCIIGRKFSTAPIFFFFGGGAMPLSPATAPLARHSLPSILLVLLNCAEYLFVWSFVTGGRLTEGSEAFSPDTF